MSNNKLQSTVQVGGEWNGDALCAWVGAASDLALMLDEVGTIRGVGCRGEDLWRKLGGVAEWVGRSWASTATPETQVVVKELLEHASADRPFEWLHVDHNAPGERSTSVLYSATRIGAHIVAHGRDLAALDFADVVMEQDAALACAHASSMRNQGVELQTLCLDILAPAARRFGDLWEEDTCSFLDVTVGLGCLHEVLRALDVQPRSGTASPEKEKRILLAMCPGEQHTFGLAMVATFFRHAMWHVQEEYTASSVALAEAASRSWFAVIGLSATCEGQVDTLTAIVRKLKRASCNPAVRILVGGKVFNDRPELAIQVGADAIALDGRHAVSQAQRLLDEGQSLEVAKGLCCTDRR